MKIRAIERFLTDTTICLQSLKKSEERFSRQLASDFQMFDAFRVDEMTLSRCLSGLLDPNGNHGQEELFLEAFLKLIGAEIDLSDIQRVRIFPEAVITDDRRIDLLLELDNHLIGIENKPWANYQDQQLHAYANWLKDHSKNSWMLVCLANDEPPQAAIGTTERKSLEMLNQFHRVSFFKLADFLDEAAKFAQALPVRIYAEHLSKFVKTQINGTPDMAEIEELEILINADAKNIESIVSIANAWPEIRQRKLNKLKNDLEKGWEDACPKASRPMFHWDPGLESESAECWFGFSWESNQKFIPCFAFEKAGLRDFYWGVKPMEGQLSATQTETVEELFLSMNNKFKMHGKKNNWWAWWMYADRLPLDLDLQDWHASPDPWIAASDGTLAEQLVKVAFNIKAAIESKGGRH